MCYANATLQALFSLKSFRKILGPTKKGGIMGALEEMCKAARNGKSTKSPEKMMNVFQKTQEWDWSQQQDAHHFMCQMKVAIDQH